MTTNDKLREALGLAKTKLQLYRQQHSGAYVGGMEYTALMKLIDEALAASKQEPSGCDCKSPDWCRVNEVCANVTVIPGVPPSKQEPQAQAAPEAVWRKGEHEYRKVDGRWQLHYLPTDDGIPLRYCHAFESDKLDAIAKKDAALDACALPESYAGGALVSDKEGGSVVRLHFGNAEQAEKWFEAITQAKEARK